MRKLKEKAEVVVKRTQRDSKEEKVCMGMWDIFREER